MSLIPAISGRLVPSADSGSTTGGTSTGSTTGNTTTITGWKCTKMSREPDGLTHYYLYEKIEDPSIKKIRKSVITFTTDSNGYKTHTVTESINTTGEWADRRTLNYTAENRLNGG